MENHNLKYLRAKAMVLMARADNRLFPEEERELDDFMDSMELNNNQKKLLSSLRLHSDEKDYQHLIDSLKILENEELKTLIVDIYRMSLKDRNLDKNELDFIESVFIKAGGSKDEWPQLLKKLKNSYES